MPEIIKRADGSNHKYAEPIINVIKICGIGIWTIFEAVFRYLPFFLMVLRYWVPPPPPISPSLSKHFLLLLSKSLDLPKIM